MLQRILKWLGQGLLLLVVLSLAITLIFRWAPLPTSALMLIRSGEMQAAGKPLKRDYRWVSLDDISPNLQKAVVAAEDQRFYEHYGFDFEAIEKAVEHNKISKRKKGASTISQQTAKNVFLWPGRSWLRKGIEAYCTVLIELIWPKERILEVYLNIAEWGDGVYGAEAAARHYFDKTASKLTLGESARLAACLPSPRKWSPGRPNPYVLARAGAIMFAVKRMEAQRLLDEVGQELSGRTSEDEEVPAAKRRVLRSDEAPAEPAAEAVEPPADSADADTRDE